MPIVGSRTPIRSFGSEMIVCRSFGCEKKNSLTHLGGTGGGKKLKGEIARLVFGVRAANKREDDEPNQR